MRYRRSIVTGFGLVLLAALPGCGTRHDDGGKDALRVTVCKPLSGTVPNYEYFTGNTKAVNFVDVRARVSGYLDRLFVKEGDWVEGATPLEEQAAGAVGWIASSRLQGPWLAAASLYPARTSGTKLYEIDPRLYQAAYDKADADLARARTSAETAERDLIRETNLQGTKGASSQKDFDAVVGRRGEALASILAAEAAKRDAKLNLDFTTVYSPIKGRIGLYKITKGNLVEKDKTVLTTIVSLDPMYAYFPIDENRLLHVKQLIREGKFKSATSGAIVPVDMQLADQTTFPYKGVINFVDPELDPRTGTLQIRGQFDNKDGSLTPGLFVRTRVAIGTPGKKLLVTERAVVSQQGKKYVYVVDDKKIVQSRPVVLGPLHDGLRVIEEGLTGDEDVIINGIQLVRPGVTVDPVEGKMGRVPGQDAAAR